MKSTKLRYLFEFPKFKKEISKLNDIIFFFPFYHFGGGERVHADILEIFKDYPTTSFIIHKSENDFMKEDFYKYSEIIDLGKYVSLKYDSYCKVLANEINKKEKPIIFGCNNLFFYRLIPFLNSNVKIIDLTHAFTYEDPRSPEKFSITLVDKINTRIVLGAKTLNDFKDLYVKEGVDENYLKRIRIIRNKVDAPQKFPDKPHNKNIKIIFVARNRYEKRPEVFFEIAQRCSNRKIPAEFLVIGDFEKSIPHPENMTILGSIKDRNLLNFYYQQSDLIFITSFREGFPMVLLEAMAYGTVPISTDVGEIREFIGEKFNNGILIKDNSIQRYVTERPVYGLTEEWLPDNLFQKVPSDLEECIEDFIAAINFFSKNREELISMGKNAYEMVVNNFSSEIKKEAYLKVFFE